MRMTISFLSAMFFFLLAIPAAAQQRIYYSEPDREDVRQLRFEIMGKYAGNYLVYKNSRNRHYIAVYDPEMKLKEKVNLEFIPDRVINVDVFSLSESSVIIYQYQKRSIVYCMGVTIGSDGKPVGEPLQLDTTQIGTFGDNKIYSTIVSDDKQKLMVFKMKSKQRDDFTVTTLLLNANLMPVRKTSFNYYLESYKESIADFYLDNEGNFVFSHVTRPGQREYINKAKLVVLPVYSDTLKKFDLTVDKVFLEELRIKVDNMNGRYVLASLYSKTKRGNIDGLFIAAVNKDFSGTDVEKAIEFNDEFRENAKGDNSTKFAFNDYYLKHFIVKKDGGVIITGESSYSNNRGNNFNRWDNPWAWGGYSPYMGWNSWNNWGMGGWGWGGPWGMNNFGTGQQIRFFADNVMVLSLDKNAELQWNNVIAKTQFDDNTDNMLSYQIMNSGAELLFLYNEWSRRNPMLNAQSVNPTGKVNREPPLKSLDRGFEFMIRFGKQVSAREMLVPCMYRTGFSFARIEF